MQNKIGVTSNVLSMHEADCGTFSSITLKGNVTNFLWVVVLRICAFQHLTATKKRVHVLNRFLIDLPFSFTPKNYTTPTIK
jgi:hypothetical protein